MKDGEGRRPEAQAWGQRLGRAVDRQDRHNYHPAVRYLREDEEGGGVGTWGADRDRVQECHCGCQGAHSRLQ